MELKNLLIECRGLLSNAGLPAPRVRLSTSGRLLSSAFGNKISIGLGASVLQILAPGCQRAQHTMLHELFHVLVYKYYPCASVRRVFGTTTAWDAEQNLLLMAKRQPGYVTRYAQTHPEEDLVETSVSVLLNDGASTRRSKKAAVRRWFKALRRKAG